MTETIAYRVADLSQTKPTRFNLRPDANTCQDIATRLGLDGLRKLSLVGEVKASGKRDWVLTAKLGATVTQACVVTLDPVVTRIDSEFSRTYLKVFDLPQSDDEEIEMPEDETIEPLPDVIDLAMVMEEALALALPEYPRKDGAHLGEAIYSEPGIAPMKDEDTRPFAGLAALRDQIASRGSDKE